LAWHRGCILLGSQGETNMKLKALFTTLVLGSSLCASVAVARPVSAPIVRDHRAPAIESCGPVYTPPVYQPRPLPPVYPSWMTLGGVDTITDGEMSFRVGKIAREFSTLKLQSTAGKSLIYRVQIQFTNGRTQTVELNRYLNAANPTITIDLDGRMRGIAEVTVIGRNARQSAFQVLAI
jgi:hypothetical protein